MAKNKQNNVTQMQSNNQQEEFAAEFAPQRTPKPKKKNTSKTK